MIVGRQITNCDFLHFAPSYRRNPISTRPFIDKRTISVSEIIDYRRLIEDIDYLMAWQRIPPWCAIIKTARRHKRVGVVAQSKIKSKKGKGIERLLSEQTTVILNAVDQKLAAQSANTLAAVDERLVAQNIAILAAVDKRLEKFENLFRDELSRLTNTLDKFLKRLTDTEEEFVFMKHDVNRIKAVLREKLGVALD